MPQNVILFTLENCVHCKSLKKRLKNENLNFHEIEITNNEKIWNEVINQTGHNSLPTIFIRKNDSDVGSVYIAGIDFMSDEEGLNIIKQYV